MTKFLFSILLLFFLSTGIAQTNIYHPFPVENAVWNVSYENWWGVQCLKYSYFTDGDTTINNLLYNKIRKRGQEYVLEQNPNITYYFECTNQLIQNFNYYSGAIREDLSQKKVYFIEVGTLSETLLYDFNLNVGDTIKGYFQNWFGSNYGIIVSAMDSTLIGTDYRKTWVIQPECGWGGMPRITEGIGCEYGLLELPCGIEKTIRTLECFSVNNQNLYPTYDSTAGCNILTSVAEEQNVKTEVAIFPNPSTGNFELNTDNMQLNSLEIKDILGNSVLKASITNGHVDIDFTEKAQGVYFIQINDAKGNMLQKKIIKQ